MAQPTPPPAESVEAASAPFPQEALLRAELGRASLSEVRATLAERAKPYLDELKAQGFPDKPFIDQNGERVEATYSRDGKVTSLTAVDPAQPYGQNNFHRFSFNQDGSIRDGNDVDGKGNGEILVSRNPDSATLVVLNHEGTRGTSGEPTMIRVPYSGGKPGTPKDIMFRLVPPN